MIEFLVRPFNSSRNFVKGPGEISQRRLLFSECTDLNKSLHTGLIGTRSDQKQFTKGNAISAANSNRADQTAQINYYAHLLFAYG